MGAGHVKVMAEDEWAHIVLIAALSFTDDTALLRKAIVPELLVRSMPFLPLHDLNHVSAVFQLTVLRSHQHLNVKVRCPWNVV